MIERRLSHLLAARLERFPAVALVGPRQVGKTTLAKNLGGRYFDLEKPQDRLRFDAQWESVVADRGLVVLDEAQAAPAIFPRLRGAIDEDRRRNGRFLLLGSISPALMTEVSQSLAGRLALCELTPFLLAEVGTKKTDPLWRMGGYPGGGILDPRQYPVWQESYLELMAGRDLPNWGLPARPVLTRRLFHMLAVLHGQPWNASQVGKSLGLSYHTVNSYLDYLEDAFLIRRLAPYAANLKKRLIKSPKVYWRDSGLLHALLALEARDDLFTKPWVGASWEGWIIEQLLNRLSCAGKSFQAYYLRTSDRQEIDLILEYTGKLWAIEVKVTSVPDSHDLERLRAIAGRIRADHCLLISRCSQIIEGRGFAALNPATAIERIVEV